MNPEFKKHLWLELSLHRLIATPVLIGIVLFAMFFIDTLTGNLGAILVTASLAGVFLFSCIGGSYAVASAMATEHNNKSWDWVRLGSRSAWEVTWGKIFGASSYMIYGAAWFLVIYLALPFLFSLETPSDLRFKMLLIVLITALFVLALSLAGALAINEQFSSKRTSRNFGASAAFFALILTSALPNITHYPSVNWYNLDIDTLNFLILWGTIFAVWAWVGCYRLMRTQLKFKNGSLVWVLFNLSIIFFLCGFVNATASPYYSILLMVAYFISIAIFYLGLFAFPPTARSINALFTYISNKSWHEVEKVLPPWVTSLAIATIWMCISMIGFFSKDFALFGTGLILLCIRDAGIFVIFSYGKNYQRAAATLLVYLVFFYAVVPFLIFSIFKGQSENAFLYVQPFWPSTLITSPIFLLSETILVYWVVMNRLKKHRSG